MPLHADIHGELFTVDLRLVSAADAVVYQAQTGERLDVRLAAMLADIPETADGWSLVDRAVLKWLALGQAGVAVSLPDVFASVTLFPPEPEPDPTEATPETSPAPDGAGDVGAPVFPPEVPGG